MTIVSDHAFHIGEQHLRQGTPSQDYTATGTRSENAAFATLSDGCSSGGATDIGARLLVLATRRALSEASTLNPTLINRERDLYLETYRRTLELAPSDMLATSLWATLDSDTLTVNVTGDGVFALIFADDTPVHFYEVSWDKNTPYYPAYRLSGLNEQFKQLHDSPTPLTVIRGQVDNPIYTEDTYYIEPGLQGLTFTFARVGEMFPTPIIGVALFSDGVTQVDGYTTAEVVGELTHFKSTSGQFFTRRLNRFLQDARKRGRGPLDDIAGAVLYDERNEL